MTLIKPPKLWQAYLVACIGTALSLFLWYTLWRDIQVYFRFVTTYESYLPWIALVLGMCITLLLSAVIRIAQLARQRTVTLNEMNENLKIEIKERINAEETKQKLEVALLQGQKLQAMGNLAGGIAHDFNNILYAIIGYVELAREDVDKNSLAYKNLGKVLDGAHRGRDLVSRILAFSRRQHHNLESINSKTTIEAVLSLLRPTIPASITIQFQPDIEDVIEANQTQIHQVLVNIINNAVDAMEGEGTITIHTSRITANDPYLKQFPEAKANQDYCKIEISDTGHGMDQVTMERIFDPFYTTKEVGKGTGLGLSIVHTIIEEHNGQINVSSQLGRGTTFTILLKSVENSSAQNRIH